MAFKGITVNTPVASTAHIMAADDAAIYEAIIGEDRVLNIGANLNATVITNNKIRISDGVAVVGGHVGRMVKGDYEDLTIENGTSGQKRNDLIVARFMQGDTDTYTLAVIKGETGAAATDPAVVKGDLYAEAAKREFPLWRICLEGLSIVKVQQMFEIAMTNKDLSNSIATLNSNLADRFKFTEHSLTGTGSDWIQISQDKIPQGYKLASVYNYAEQFNRVRVVSFGMYDNTYYVYFNMIQSTTSNFALRFCWIKDL